MLRWLPVTGGVLASVGGLLWLRGFLDTDEGPTAIPLALFPLLFGAGVVGLGSIPGARPNVSRWVRVAAVAAATAASVALVVSENVAAESWLAYAGWLVFVGGLVGLWALVIAFGMAHLRTPRLSGIARLAVLVGVSPLAFTALGFGYKALTGWWVTDPDLIRIGEVTAALVIGGGWLILGCGIAIRALISSRP